MAPTVKLGASGVWIHRRAFEAAEANYLSGGGIQILKTNSQTAPVAAASLSVTQSANHAGGGRKKKGKSGKKGDNAVSPSPVSPSPVQDVSRCPSKSPTPDIRVIESIKNNTKDESGPKDNPSNKAAGKETSEPQRQVQSQKEQQSQPELPVQKSQSTEEPQPPKPQQQQQPQPATQPQQQQQKQQESQGQSQQQQSNANHLQAKSKNGKRKKNKSQSESTSEDTVVTETKEQNDVDKRSQPVSDAVVSKQQSQETTAAPATATAVAAAVAADDPAVKSVIASQLQQVRAQINQVLGKAASSTSSSGPGMDALVAENKALKATVDQLVARLNKLELRVTGLEGGKKGDVAAAKSSPAAPAKAKAPVKDDDDDDVDLFGSDDDEDANAARDQRLKEYAEKKAKKPGPIAKSSIVLDIKPWEDDTDMAAMEKAVRTIAMDGLVWGASKLVPIAYGVKKLQIVCVIEDDKVGVDDLQEQIAEFSDYVQSVDVAAFNKI